MIRVPGSGDTGKEKKWGQNVGRCAIGSRITGTVYLVV